MSSSESKLVSNFKILTYTCILKKVRYIDRQKKRKQERTQCTFNSCLKSNENKFEKESKEKSIVNIYYRCMNYRPMGSKNHLLDAHWKTESSQKNVS